MPGMSVSILARCILDSGISTSRSRRSSSAGRNAAAKARLTLSSWPRPSPLGGRGFQNQTVEMIMEKNIGISILAIGIATVALFVAILVTLSPSDHKPTPTTIAITTSKDVTHIEPPIDIEDEFWRIKPPWYPSVFKSKWTEEERWCASITREPQGLGVRMEITEWDASRLVAIKKAVEKYRVVMTSECK